MRDQTPEHATGKSWKKFFGGLAAVVLLAPIPAYATLTLGNTGGGSQPWASILIQGNNSTAGIWGTPTKDTAAGVSFQPVSGTASAGADTFIDIYASINSGSQINSVATGNFQSMKVTGTVTISVQVFKNLSITGPFTNLTPPYSNQFSNQQLPPSSTGVFGTPGTASISGYSYIHVRFDFTPGSSWTATPSSPVTILFTGS